MKTQIETWSESHVYRYEKPFELYETMFELYKTMFELYKTMFELYKTIADHPKRWVLMPKFGKHYEFTRFYQRHHDRQSISDYQY